MFKHNVSTINSQFSLINYVAVCLTDTRQVLAVHRQVTKEKPTSLSELLSDTSSTIVNRIKSILTSLKVCLPNIFLRYYPAPVKPLSIGSNPFEDVFT